MDCPDPGVIAKYVDNDLEPTVRTSVGQHAEACAVCGHLISQLAGLARTGSQDDAGAIGTQSEAPTSDRMMGRYIVQQRVGQGGTGIVLAAYDPTLDRRVAIKLLNHDRGDELVREARALAKLAHENVVAVLDVGEVDARAFVAMEFVDGGDLRAWLTAPHTWREIITVFRAAGRGLAASHDAGLVHHDFKPANVLMSKSGRVLVTDFGVVGTPEYMSPEQLAGEPTDARSDQFSFCVALYEALYRARPFAKPAKTPVPAAIHRVLLRGLARAPADRYRSMTELLAALESASWRRAARWIALAAVLVVSVGAFAVYKLRGDEVCAGARPKIDEIWSATTRTQLQLAFVATNKPYAARAFANAATTIDHYADTWIDLHLDACQATSVKREQSEDVLDLRMDCLERRRGELRAIVDVLAHADSDVVQHATDVTNRLVPVTGCSDITALKSPVRLPSSPQVRGQILALHSDLERALVLSDAAKIKKALEIVPPVLASARSLHYQPLEAEALLVLSDLQAQNGDEKASEASLRASVLASEASGDELDAAKAWTGLLVRLGVGQNKYPEALQTAEHARAILDRRDPHGLDMAHFQHALGVVLQLKGDYKAARTAIMAAIEIYDRLLPPGDYRVERTYNDLGNIEWRESHLDKAFAIFERVRANLEKAYGPDHPMVAGALGNLSNVLVDQGKYADAMTALQRSIAIDTAALGADNPELVFGYNGMGDLAADLGHEEEALGWYKRAFELANKIYGPEHRTTTAVLVNMSIIERHRNQLALARQHIEQALHGDEKREGTDSPEVAVTLSNLESLALDEGKVDEAEQLAQRVLAIRLKAFGPDSPDVARTYVSLANVAQHRKRYDDSITWLQKALPIQEKRLGPDSRSVAITLHNFATSYSALGKLADAEAAARKGLAIIEAKTPDAPEVADFLTVLSAVLFKQNRAAEAAPFAERALVLRRKTKVQPLRIAETEDALARILWQTGDRDRARLLARSALAAFPIDDPETRHEHDDLAAWMKNHQITPQ